MQVVVGFGQRCTALYTVTVNFGCEHHWESLQALSTSYQEAKRSAEALAWQHCFELQA